ncbi:putative enzyme related to lactoylglutathione lyase [Arthrobacter sp. GAS37]|uniref:VOC family protein n=1 Tax=Arthrobacter sp. GAS37 TaxID=3156261 RepID=UPI003838CAB6
MVNQPGAWNFSDLHTSDPGAAIAFYEDVFGWQVDDLGFAVLIRRPGYGDHLEATVDPGIRARQSGVAAPPGFEDAIAWVATTAPDEPSHWHVSFTVADRDQTVAVAKRLGAQVLRQNDTEWTRTALIRDPQGSGVHRQPVHAPIRLSRSGRRGGRYVSPSAGRTSAQESVTG